MSAALTVLLAYGAFALVIIIAAVALVVYGLMADTDDMLARVFGDELAEIRELSEVRR